jgi:signal transduction histidine kinase/CheY-like chemotaxis protein
VGGKQGQATELTREARALQLITWASPFAFASALVLFGAAAFYSARGTLIVGVVVATITWPLTFPIRRLIVRGQFDRALLLVGVASWSVSASLALTHTTEHLAIAALLAVLPVVVSLPYASRRAMPRILFVATAFCVMAAVFSITGPPFEFAMLPQTAGRVSSAAFVLAVLGLYLAASWHSNAQQRETLDEMAEANRALRDSERSLERKVVARTNELAAKNDDLERSQQDLAAARDAALEANQAKSAFLASMSHELRTPLNAIIGYSEMMQEEAEDSGNTDLIPDLQTINRSGRYLLTVINGVLDLAKIESGKMDVFVEDFDLAELIRGVEGTIKPLIRQNSNTLDTGSLEGLGRMHSDLTKVRQVLFNLLSNASKFTTEGTIELEVARETLAGSDWVLFAVSDSGIGMTPLQLERVFEEFSQADASTTRKYGGTGLGLSIAKRFCEKLGGSISAISEAGRGSCFEFRLPAEAPQVLAPHPSHTDAATVPAIAVVEPIGRNESHPTVLVVDDDSAAVDLTTRFLVREGFEVITASSGEAALHLARECHPDLITLDIAMPHMDGWEVLRELKADAATSAIPVFVLTMLEQQNLGFSLGAEEYLIKPIDWEKLGAIVKRYGSDSHTAPALVVDDDPVARDMLRRGLEKHGWSVVEAANGREALERVMEVTPGLVLLDLIMPKMDGFEFADRLARNEAWREIPVVVITAKPLTGEEHTRLEGNVARIFQKGSYGRDELVREIQRLVGPRGPSNATSMQTWK